ncbi:ATP-dependent DNA helicase RecQ, partial [Streptomyces sp. SID7982]|nr:ATP-dependent DNA helicase RecQ [Streptomyces sp. SID7982]
VEGEYGTLVLTDESATVLGRERDVLLRKEPKKPTSRSSSSAGGGRGAKGKAAAADLPESAVPVFEALRAWRGATAKEQGVPAYVIFHDATLREIATVHPTTIGELGGISGLGEKKLATYGEGVLEVLAQTSPGAAPETPPAPAAPAPAPRAATPARTQAPAAPQHSDPEFGWDEEPPEYE